MYTANLKSMEEKISTFSKIGATGNGGITRYSLSPEAHQARDLFVSRMKAIGAEIETDDLANIYATLPGSEPGLKRIAMGSHVDSVKCGGNYDGILGVMGAMEVLETIAKNNIPHRHPITAVVWTNEEGSEFTPSMIGSGVVTGQFEKDAMMKVVSMVDGTTTFGEALSRSPYLGKEENRLSPDKYQAMIELHIEQGPILEDAGKDIGVVVCVLGMINYRIRFTGQATHAGTTPMPKRRDALYAAAETLCELHKKIDALNQPDLVYTTGEIVCHPCVHTVVPDMVEFSIDSRHENPEVLEKVLDIIMDYNGKEVKGCSCQVEKAWCRDTVYFDKELVECVQKSVDALGISNQRINSGAGHDSQYVAHVIPTTMVFVPSVGGHSHCEIEYTPAEQCTAGASVLLNAVLLADEK